MSNVQPKFNLGILKQLWRVTRPYLFEDRRRHARGLLTLLLLLSLAVAGVNEFMS